MKKIAIVCGSLCFGGVERALINLLRLIDKDNYDLTLWLPDFDGGMENQIPDGISVRLWREAETIDYKRLLFQALREGKIMRAAKSIWNRLLAAFYAKRKNWKASDRHALKSMVLGEKELYDTVVVFQSLSVEQTLFACNCIRGKHLLGWMHSDYTYTAEARDRRAYKNAFQRMDAIICVSEAVKSTLQNLFPALKTKTSVIYNLQPIERIRKLADEPIAERFEGVSILTVGRVTPVKGQDMIPGIAKKLLQMGQQFTWYVIGDGTLKPELQAQIEQDGLQQTVKLLGAKANPYPYIKNCSLYVQPSYTEGFCIATFEAKILNKHVVSTNFPAIHEQFSEGEAVFAEPTVESLTAAIVKALETIDEPVRYAPVTEEYNARELDKLYRLLDP